MLVLLLQLTVVAAGTFSGTRVFSANAGSPGVRDFVDVSFTPATEIPIGGSIDIVMPSYTGIQSGWNFETPAGAWQTPATGAATAESIAFNAGSRTVTIVTASNAIAVGAAQVIRGAPGAVDL